VQDTPFGSAIEKRAGRLEFNSWQRQEFFCCSTVSILRLEHIPSPVQWLLGDVSASGKSAGTQSCPLTYNYAEVTNTIRPITYYLSSWRSVQLVKLKDNIPSLSHYVVFSSPFFFSFSSGPDILHRTLFLNTNILGSSLNIRDQISHTYKLQTYLDLKVLKHQITDKKRDLKSNCSIRILSHIPGLCGSVTNNSTTRVRIGYRIYSLWRFIAAADYNYFDS
jgi:hypothetical protein